MTDLVPYDQARILLAEAKTVDDVKEIHDKAIAMAEYRKRAGDRTLEIDAIEIRMFAERRLGQMIAAQKASTGLHKGGRPAADKTGAATEPVLKPTLADAGISKKLSAKAQKMAAIAPEAFDAKLAAWRTEALSEDRVTTNLLHVGRQEEQRESRRALAQALADTSFELTGERTFPCFYADPAFARKAGIGDRAYENHYPTEQWDGLIEIMKKLAGRLQPNAWGFIWIPRAHMLALHPVSYKVQIDDGSIHEITIKIPLIWALARAGGMDEYSTCFVWTKTDEEHPDEHGTFLIARDQDEILCLYKKGDGLPRPPPEHIYGSNHRERSRPLGHSVKPPFYRKMIADMVGTDAAGRPLPVLELFARFDKDHPLPDNWEAWGNQSAPDKDGGVGASIAASAAGAPLMDPAPESNAADGMGSFRVGAGSALSNSEIPQEGSGTARKAPGGPLYGGPSVVADATAGEAEHSSPLHSYTDDLRWQDDGGAMLIVKPPRTQLPAASWKAP